MTRISELASLLALAGAVFGGCFLWTCYVPDPRLAQAQVVRIVEEDIINSALVQAIRAEPAPDFGHAIELDDPSGHALDHIHDALRAAARDEGQARIVVYGGSHTASDHYTGEMRTRLQRHFGDAGYGFIPLFPVVAHPWARGMRIDQGEGFALQQVDFKHREIDRYGLVGLSFRSDSADSFAAVQSDHWGTGRFASRLAFFYDQRPDGGNVEVHIDGHLADNVSTAQTVPTPGATYYTVSDGPHRLEVRPQGNGMVHLYGAVFERETPGVLVENWGLIGSKARHQLLWNEAQRAFFLRERRPDLIAFAYGNNETNDTDVSMAHHEAHFRAAWRRVRQALPEASCLVIGPTDRLMRLDNDAIEAMTTVRDLSDMQRGVAHEFGCAFFDTLAFQGGWGGSRAWLEHDPPLLRPDLQHLTEVAYRRLGHVLTDAILAGLDENEATH